MDEKTVMNRADLKVFLGAKNLGLKHLVAQGLPYIRINAGRVSYIFIRSSVLSWLKTLEQNTPQPKNKPVKPPERKKLV